MDSSRIKKLIRALIPVSRKAGAAILEVYNTTDLGIQQKSDSSPLTKADLASNTIICNALKELSPDIPIISEENDDHPYAERSKWEYCWIVDPLDGTKEFIKKNGEFTTNIGLVYNHRVVAGVVYIPVFDEMYFAVKGEGAFKISQKGEEKISAAAYKTSDQGLKVICSRSHLNDETQAFVDALSQPELVAKGSSLKFLSIAQGEADVYPRLAPTMEWDTCAAQIILEEAGGQVLIANGDGKTVQYNKENLLNPFFIAKGAEIV
ncbi:MAG: 3'(2'),5'-bisphosphate nucleotidase CysQ [Bacteroidota bacterium]